MVGFCHLTDSHHYHRGQKPTMVGICHGGNLPLGHDDDETKEQLYDDKKPKIIKIDDHFKGSGFVELSGKKIKAKFLLQMSLRKNSGRVDS